MIEFYPEIRAVHVAAVLASGGVFLLRGAALIAGSSWVRAAPLRYLGYSIDTVWLTAALMLMNMVQQFPIRHGWLTMKVGLLLVYVTLGFLAFRRGGSRRAHVGCWIAGLAVYAFIYSVARAHHPLGFMVRLTG